MREATEKSAAAAASPRASRANRGRRDAEAPRRMPSRRPSKKRTFDGGRQFLEPLMENLISLLCEGLDSELPARNAAVDARRLDAAIDALSSTCKFCRHLATSSPRLRFYSSFARSLGPYDPEKLFLEDVKNIDIWTGDYGFGPRGVMETLTIPAILKDRHISAKHLLSFDYERLRLRTSHYAPNDLPRDVGLRVKVFVGRARALARRFVVANPGMLEACQMCGRWSVRGPVQHLQARRQLVDATVVDTSDEDDASDQDLESPNDFWMSSSPALVSFLQETPAPHACCAGCAAKFKVDYRAAVPVTAAFLNDFEARRVPASKTGLARVTATASALQQRNAAAVRSLREARRSHKEKRPMGLSIRVIERLHELILDMLNVDLAMILAAAALAESPIFSASRSLPACSAVWREYPERWMPAVERVRAIYYEFGGPRTREKPLSWFDQPRWLRVAIERAPDIFPSTCSPH